MSHNNAAEVNIECEKAMTTSLLNLNDFVLLRVFSYLNLRDSINFAETSKRLKSVSVLHFTKYKRIDLVGYKRFYRKIEQSEPIPAETVLSHIGKHVENLSINSMRSTVAKADVDNCVNVKTFKIYTCNDTSELKNWMQEVKLQSLSIRCSSHFNKMRVELEGIRELHFTGVNSGLSAMQLTNILGKTTELQNLKVHLFYPNFSYDIFTKLLKLKCLDIELNSRDLVNLTEFLKMDALSQFKLSTPVFDSRAESLQRVNSFLERLAERSKLNELQLCTRSVDQNTFRILKAFQLTSLGLYEFDHGDHTRDECWMIHQLVDTQPNLKHLDTMDKFLRVEHVHFVVKNLVKLETFTFRMQTNDLEQLDDSVLNEIVTTTTSRPMLTLYINSKMKNGVEIKFWLEQRK